LTRQGSDTGSNTSLNREWIRLKNTENSGRWLTDWTVRDSSGHVYRFGTYRLGAGKTVLIHTGSGSSSARHRYWGQDEYVWNNDGDRARLRKPNGNTVDNPWKTKTPSQRGFRDAPARIRTWDPRIRSPLLCPLSYRRPGAP
jgi:Lamin Tail Domain